MSEQSKMRKRYIPKNVFQGKRIFGCKAKNFKEGIIAASIVSLLVNQIPFVPKVKWIIIICLFIAILSLNAIGIKNQTISEFARNYLKYRKQLATYQYRRITDAKRKEPIINDKGQIRTIQKAKTYNFFRQLFFKG